MADEDEFKIKGAAQKIDLPRHASVETDSSLHGEDATSEQVTAEPDVSKDSNKLDEKNKDSKLSDEQKYRWFKCKADESTYGKDQTYYIHADTQESSWTEPQEPYWIFDAATGKADPIGLQFPNQSTRTRSEVLQLEGPKEWGGYNPKIHGNYDPNADYARVHETMRVEEEAALNPFDTSMAPVPGGYQSALATNRFTGSFQAPNAGPERHSDAAKSGRQMNAFFDVDAAANAHDGRSLKDERKAQKLSKEQVKAFNKARHEKKQKKKLAFYKS